MTYQMNLGIPDDMAADVKSFADRYGITLAAAVRVLLRQALNNEEETP
jgi:antitoxin component of RelBE/YafQ-DinJ toxin-antitoxin module